MPGGTGGVGRSVGWPELEPGRDLKLHEQGEAEAGDQGNRGAPISWARLRHGKVGGMPGEIPEGGSAHPGKHGHLSRPSVAGGVKGPSYMGSGSTLIIDWSPHRNTLPSSVPADLLLIQHHLGPEGLGCSHSSLSLWKCGHVRWGP